VKGEAALLLQLLERRFGALPAEVIDRVAGADAAALEALEVGHKPRDYHNGRLVLVR
jgi:hypothetical protein